MLPLWFFIVLVTAIFYLLYVTRMTDDNIVRIGKNGFKRLQFWVKENVPQKQP